MIDRQANIRSAGRTMAQDIYTADKSLEGLKIFAWRFEVNGCFGGHFIPMETLVYDLVWDVMCAGERSLGFVSRAGADDRVRITLDRPCRGWLKSERLLRGPPLDQTLGDRLNLTIWFLSRQDRIFDAAADVF